MTTVIQTWAKAYGEIADVFIKLEQEIYNHMLWKGFKPFKITNITQEKVTSNLSQLNLKNMI